MADIYWRIDFISIDAANILAISEANETFLNS